MAFLNVKESAQTFKIVLVLITVKCKMPFSSELNATYVCSTCPVVRQV